MNKVSGGEVSVLYIDYGNKETIPKTKCAALPSSFTGLPPFAKEYGVAFLALPPDVSIDFKYREKHEMAQNISKSSSFHS